MARVLLVEDHPDVHDLLCNVLRQLGHKADCVRTATLARIALAAGAYDLVICNLGLPDGSGRDVAALARAAGIKIVLTSGHPDALQALNAARVEHLAKPFRVMRPSRIFQAERSRGEAFQSMLTHVAAGSKNVPSRKPRLRSTGTSSRPEP